MSPEGSPNAALPPAAVIQLRPSVGRCLAAGLQRYSSVCNQLVPSGPANNGLDWVVQRRRQQRQDRPEITHQSLSTANKESSSPTNGVQRLTLHHHHLPRNRKKTSLLKVQFHSGCWNCKVHFGFLLNYQNRVRLWFGTLAVGPRGWGGRIFWKFSNLPTRVRGPKRGVCPPENW